MSKLTDLIQENRRLQRQVDYLAAETKRGEAAILRRRIAELEAAQRGARCPATTVDPSTPDRPSCAWCVLPAGHQGMHRAELTQDYSAPATLEWPSEVTE
ncbi:hypothetical protein [Nocardia sp. MW-W600-9]